MRLIDAENIPYTMLYKENWMGTTGKEARGAWKSDIDKMPTVDAVPVVRCKDCKWWEQIDDGQYGYCSPRKYGFYKGDWFCADGERRAE